MTKEQQIENSFIEKLKDLKYSFRADIRDKAGLEQNFRQKFEALNRVNLTDAEYSRLHDEIITADVFKASQALREKGKFTREDGTPLEYTLVNVRDWCKNDFEVIHQLRINTDNSHHRYDVILLINGLPLVQIELKTLQISPRRAMEQIVEYKNDAGNGYTNSLLCFMQLFIVSNGNNTLYFANNRKEHFSFNADERFLPIYQHADRDNKKITHLHDFAEDFLAKCTLGQLISRYMVLVQSEQKMLVMRPYQIYAVKAIVDAIHENRGNGYIWHTTGSGKTLTSFKASTLLKDNPDIEKCLFVVDRKDLDRQTRLEFNKFQENCVEENTNTETLVRRMLSEDYADKVIVTTIQKLGLALDESSKRNKAQQKDGKKTFKERLEPLRDKRIVFIFDECHRSQFGENQKAIKEFFPKAQLFGFTGTPIFDENASYVRMENSAEAIPADKAVAYNMTTQKIFEKELHAYTITHAIEDRNVLSFHIDYFGMKEKEKVATKKTSPPIQVVVEEIVKKHDHVTNQRKFNAVLATASINDAILYHDHFLEYNRRLKGSDSGIAPLNIACVFSPPAYGLSTEDDSSSKNIADIKQLQEDLPQEQMDNQVEPEKKKEALKKIIADYNEQYGTNHSINEFDQYYQDIQKRIKDQQFSNADYARKNKIDITIVVDMLLTGFDSKYLNTLYVDKNLKHHGLIQAFSRTNRVLNDSKPHGNILDFRDQESEVDTAIALFSGASKEKSREIWLVDPAPKVIAAYQKKVEDLHRFMESKGLPCEPAQVANLMGDIAKIEFTNHFKEIQRLKTQLDQYTDLDEASKVEVEQKLPADALRGFRAMYLDTALELKRKQGKSSDPTSLLSQQELQLVIFASAIIDYDYIMKLIAQSTQSTSKQKMTRQQVIEIIKSHSNFELERDDIVDYINSLQTGEVLTEQQIRDGYQTFKQQKLTEELQQVAKKHGLNANVLQDFVDGILDRMIFDGEGLTDLLAPLELGWKERRKVEITLMEDLVPYLQKQVPGREISGLNAYE